MVTEHAVLDVTPGTGEEFLAAFPRGREVIAAAPGCRSVALQRCVETPDRFLLLVEWETLEDHTVGFRGSPAFGQWRAIVGPFFAAAPEVVHYRHVG